MASLYILQSEKTGQYYVGSTNDVDRRFSEHIRNHTPSTRKRGPWKLVHREDFATLLEARRRENHGQQIEEYHSLLRTKTGALSVVSVSTCVSVAVLNKEGLLQGVPRVRWFMLADADDGLIERAKQFARKLNGIEKCKADIFYGRSVGNAGTDTRTSATAEAPVSVQFSDTATTAADRSSKANNVCPECGYQFKGNGFDGIDAHWRSKHEKIMPYKEAWPLVKEGNYRRKALPQNR